MNVQNERMRELLEAEFKKANKRNPSFSMRAFAISLGVIPQELYPFLKGKRNFSSSKIEKVLETMAIEQRVKDEIMGLSSSSNLAFGVYKSNEEKFLLDDVKNSEVISNWQVIAVYTALDLDNIKFTPKELAEYLLIDIDKVNEALVILIRLGVIEEREGEYVKSGRDFQTASLFPSESIREHHRQMALKAYNAIDHIHMKERNFSSIKFCTSRKKLQKANKMLEEFRNFLADYLSSGEKEVVYNLNLQLFPLSKIKLED